MAGASADGEVNHWPAFVDVLTTVIMVVTFLLVIMSAAVMQLSQRVIANFKQQMMAEQAAKAGKAAGAQAADGKAGVAQGQSVNRLQSRRCGGRLERGRTRRRAAVRNGHQWR